MPRLIATTLALLLALAGASSAGWLVVGTGPSSALAAARHLLTGKDIRNGSIGKRDLASSARPQDGAPGADGAPGVDGSPGGPRGYDGADGAPGPQGPGGATGAPGAAGATGPQGLPGAGVRAFEFAPGFFEACPAGGYRVVQDGGNVADGFVCNGLTGARGPAGADGHDGVSNVPGPKGDKGDPGASVTGPKGDTGPQGPAGQDGDDATASMPWARVAASGVMTASSSPDFSSSRTSLGLYTVFMGGAVACTVSSTSTGPFLTTVTISAGTITVRGFLGQDSADTPFTLVCVPEA